MKIGDVFPSRYLRAADIPPSGRPVTVVRCVLEEIGPERESKPVVYFEEESKGVVLNKTNFQLLSSLLGDDSDEWRGGRVEMFATPVAFKGGVTPAIRIRPARPVKLKPTTKAGAAPATPHREPQQIGDQEDEGLDEPDWNGDDAMDYEPPLTVRRTVSGGRKES